MPNDSQTVEATNTPLGSFKISSANLNTLFTVLGFIIVCLIAYVLWMHTSDAQAGGKEVAKELKESNREIAATLRETNREVAKVLNDLSKAIREQNCLAQFETPQLKSQNADLCKRISQ